MTNLWPWFVLLGLGALHGINPGMGWLFAVCLGLQERRRMAVLAALPPIALGHALSVGLVVALIAVLRARLNASVLQYACAALLVGYGLYRVVRARHPRWVGMRVGFRDLTLWSFLMASAHGAGLMLIPVFLATTSPDSHAAMGHHERRRRSCITSPTHCRPRMAGGRGRDSHPGSPGGRGVGGVARL